MFDPVAVSNKLIAAGPVRHRFTEAFVNSLLDLAEPVLKKEPTLVRIRSPIFVLGDLHGQYSDLLRVFERGGHPNNGTRYLFLGDYVDRGKHSLECMMLLFSLKVAYPKRIFLLRGNHEIASVNRTYGFLGELKQRFARSGQWQHLFDHCNRVFAVLPLAATIDNRILCLHGGLAPELKSLAQIENIKRPLMEPSGLAECLLWSDPEDSVHNFAANKSRGVAYVFGQEAVTAKLQELGVERIIRGHQLVDHGYEPFASGKVLTIFTATSYHDTFNNPGGMARVEKGGKVELFQLQPTYPMTDDEKSYVEITD
uniref:Serine/threonine-protein phosphatase n=1 Tax=Panagrellus redivivus TaxID=6233 RepID=A0A7E4WDE4_PANRE